MVPAITCLREHGVTLRGGRVLLRPLTEADWPILLRWNSDPEVLYYLEGDHVERYSPNEVQEIYRSVSQHAICFVIEHDGEPVGDCWLQEMNLDRVKERYPGLDCRRIDIVIGDTRLWGRGLGGEAVRLLTDFAFDAQSADAVFACGVGDYNERSLRMFRRAGFRVDGVNRLPDGAKANANYDLILERQDRAASAAEDPTGLIDVSFSDRR